MTYNCHSTNMATMIFNIWTEQVFPYSVDQEKKKKVPKSKRIPWTLSQLANTVRHSPICSIEITLFVQLLLNIYLQFSPDLVSEYDNFVMIKLFTIISSHLRNVGYTIQQQQFNSIFSSSVLGTTRRSSYPTKNY